MTTDRCITVAVQMGKRERRLELCPTHRHGQVEADSDSWEVRTESGLTIGRVFKTSYTYSPPTHRGSRVARFHKQVPCWRGESGPLGERRRTLDQKTRKGVLVELLTDQADREARMAAAHEFARSHPDATFRLNRGKGEEGNNHRGDLIRVHNVGLVVRGDRNHRGGGDVKVRLRELQYDRGPRLEVQLAEGKRFRPITDVLDRGEDE